MYASNEHEFEQEQDDWVFLRRTPPTTNILNNSKHLFVSRASSSSTDTSSSKSDRSDSLSSITSNDDEEIDNNHNDLLLTSENKDEVLPCDLVTKLNNESETTPVINEYDLINYGQETSNESIEPETHLKQRTGANIQQTIGENSVSFRHEYSSSSMNINYRNQNVTRLGNIFLILFCIVLPIVCLITVSQKSMIDQLKNQLETTNEQIFYIKMFSIGDLEQKLTQQFEERFQILKMKLDQEKSLLISQIDELHQNLTNQMHHLTSESHELKEQIITLEKQSSKNDEQNSQKHQSTSKKDYCQKSSIPTIDELLSHLFKQTSTVAENTSTNLSGLLEQLSASVSGFIQNGHEYVEESKRKLTGFSGTKTAEQVQDTIRRGMENLSSSIRKAQSTYVTWLRARAERREQARRTAADENIKSNRRPWRWTFQRGQDREQMRHQTTVTRKQNFA